MSNESDFVSCGCGHQFEDHITIVEGQIESGPCRQPDCGCTAPTDPDELPEGVRCQWVINVREDGEAYAPTIHGTSVESDALTIAEFLMRDYAERAEADGNSAQGPVMAAGMLARYRQVANED